MLKEVNKSQLIKVVGVKARVTGRFEQMEILKVGGGTSVGVGVGVGVTAW